MTARERAQAAWQRAVEAVARTKPGHGKRAALWRARAAATEALRREMRRRRCA